MKALLGKVISVASISAIFNGRIANDFHTSALSESMLQAFYRREHETVVLLAGQGAQFNAEMLQVAVGFRDHNLSRACLDGGVKPNEAMVRFAIDMRDARLADMLMTHVTITPALVDYAARHGSEAVRQSVESRRI